jgi:hypothetical protein
MLFFWPIHGVNAEISALVGLPSKMSSDRTFPVPGPSVIPQQLCPLATHRPSASFPMMGVPVRIDMGR